jgi:hypothetical protein
MCVQIAIVFLMTALVVLYRVYMQVTYCAQWDPIVCLIVSTVCASVINSVVIIILGIVCLSISSFLYCVKEEMCIPINVCTSGQKADFVDICI